MGRTRRNGKNLFISLSKNKSYHLSFQQKQLIVFEQWLHFVVRNILFLIMKNVLIKNLGKKFSFCEKIKEQSSFISCRHTLSLIQLQSLGIAVANSLMFFVHSATFGYGSYLVDHGLIEPANVFR